MDRGLTPEMDEAIQARVVRPVILYDGTFNDGDVHLWSGVGTIEYSGTTYYGAGDLLQFGTMEETNQVKAAGITVSLAGVTSGAAATALSEVRRYLPGVVSLGLLDDDGIIIPDPWPMFRGLLDTCNLEDGEETATISVGYEHELIDLERPVNTRYTDAEQRRLFPGDTGMRYLISLQNKVLRWGARD